MKTVIAIFPLCLMLLGSGCSSLNVNYDWDTDADFNSYFTYTWLPQPTSGGGDVQAAIARNDLIDQRIKRAVESQLDQKGMRKQDENPDLLIAYHTGVQDKVNITDWGYRYGDAYWGWGGRQIDVQQYTEGTLVLDLINASGMNLIWRASVSLALEANPSPQRVDQRINEIVAKMLSKYPPKR
jgi:hypothetical protein